MYTIESIMPRLLQKGIPLAVVQFPHPGDSFLFTVLIYRDPEYIIWTFNAQTGGFAHGDYFYVRYEEEKSIPKWDVYKQFISRVKTNF